MDILKILLLMPIVLILVACNSGSDGSISDHVEPQLHSYESGHNVQVYSDITHILRAHADDERIIINLPALITMIQPIVIPADQNVLFRCQMDLVDNPGTRGSQFVLDSYLVGTGCIVQMLRVNTNLDSATERHFIIRERSQVQFQRVGLHTALSSFATPSFGGGVEIYDGAFMRMHGGVLSRMNNHNFPNTPFVLHGEGIDVMLDRVQLEDMDRLLPLYRINTDIEFTSSNFRLFRAIDLR